MTFFGDIGRLVQEQQDQLRRAAEEAGKQAVAESERLARSEPSELPLARLRDERLPFRRARLRNPRRRRRRRPRRRRPRRPPRIRSPTCPTRPPATGSGPRTSAGSRRGCA
jgi:hypothetical protein